MADVVIAETMHAASGDALVAEYGAYRDPDLWRRRAELMERVADARALVVRNETRVDRALLDAAPALRVVARLGVGLDNIDLDACAERGIDVCPATGANAASVAEYVIATAMILLRRPAYAATPAVLGGAWDRARFGGGLEIGGRTMGIVGFGSIGRAVARRARGMDMETLAHDAMLPESDPAWAR